MARIFKLELQLFDRHVDPDTLCVEVYETVRTAQRNRKLHFGIKNPIRGEDVDWILDAVEAEIKSLLHRTVGIQEELEF